MLTVVYIWIAGLMLSTLLARKKGRTAPPKGGGDLPWFLTCKEDRWIEIGVVLLEGMLERQENEKDWSCYEIRMAVDSGDTEDHEVPFWCMDDFYDAVVKAYERGDDTINLEYRRSSRDGLNIGEFRGV